jgi:hypothetical protein
MKPEEIKQLVWDKCVPDGCGCLIWKGSIARGGVPAFRDPVTGKTGSARRILMTAMGKNVKGRLATTKCNNPLCMAEGHVVLWTRQELQKRSAAKLVENHVRSAKLAAAARARSKLTMEQVREIRSSGLRAKEVSAQYGITLHCACLIVNGRTWRDYSNPFAGLLA